MDTKSPFLSTINGTAALMGAVALINLVSAFGSTGQISLTEIEAGYIVILIGSVYTIARRTFCDQKPLRKKK